MSTFTLSKGGFTLMREGKQTVIVTKAEGKPSANPKLIEVTVKNQYGETLNNNYSLDGANEKAMVVTSIFLKACLGDIEEFDTSDIAKLVDSTIEVEVTHTTKQNSNDETKTITFANITKVLGGAEPFVAKEKTRGTL